MPLLRTARAIAAPLCAAAALMLAGCATTSADIAPIEPPDGAYLDWDCPRLAQERRLVEQRLLDMGARIDEAAADERLAMGAGVVFWPALFAIEADHPLRERFARERGVHERLAWQWRRRNCGQTPTMQASLDP